MFKPGQRDRSSRWSDAHPGRRQRRSQGEGSQIRQFQRFRERTAIGWIRFMINVAEEMKHLHKEAEIESERWIH
jgi:hypothetical protein